MKNRNNKAIGSVIVLGILAAVSSCKPEPVKPVDTPVTPKDTVVTVEYRKNIKLYVPQIQNASASEYKFYNITTNTYSNDVNSLIELAFYYEESETSKNYLGSSASSSIRGSFGVLPSNQTEVKFYTVKDNYQTTIFDTLNDVRTIARYFNKQDLNKVVSSGNIGLVKSDVFGWDEGELFAFELPNGKRGLIKVTEKPFADFNLAKTEITYGRIVVSIKMEK